MEGPRLAPVNPVIAHPVTPVRSVPPSIPRPEYVGRSAPRPYTGSHVQSADVVERMRESGRIAADAMHAAARAIAPGVTTDELDAVAHAYMLDHGAYPSALGYRGFPKSVCTSVNEVICHGIPDHRMIEDGDIVNVDITAYLDGVHGDTNATFLAGNVAEETRLLVERTQAALDRAIAAVRPGRRVNVLGRVIDGGESRPHPQMGLQRGDGQRPLRRRRFLDEQHFRNLPILRRCR